LAKSERSGEQNGQKKKQHKTGDDVMQQSIIVDVSAGYY
jgi:hypothetical protein